MRILASLLNFAANIYSISYSWFYIFYIIITNYIGSEGGSDFWAPSQLIQFIN